MAAQTAVAGTTNAANSTTAAQPGANFGIPLLSTQPRFVPDNGNETLVATPSGSAQVNVPTTRLDQLDIVRGWKVYMQNSSTWTEAAPGDLHVSPFFPANIVQAITLKLQAAYNTFNLTGPLAALIQAYRPMWASKGMGLINPNAFAITGPAPVTATPYATNFAIDVPASYKFDEYFDLNAQGQPTRKVIDAYVTPFFMAAQARVVTPTVTLSPQLGISDTLGSPVSIASGNLSTYATSVGTAGFVRDAYWTASNPAGNPPQYPWLYTRDYFSQPTAGQGKVGCLIQNTGVSVGQVMSLFGFVWDPARNTGFGGVVPLGDIATIELVTGGSLQNDLYTEFSLTDRMQSDYGNAIVGNMPDGCFVIDKALSSDGTFLTNKNVINTYLVNGVQVNITFKPGSIPSASSTVYMGVEALKLVTS